ncbi:DUF5819 family protein [Streptomyces sp. 8L]|uniref:DUF5819 family protein n=1 Tax=Streptomyces sp. 8L TaxID=2877242 RepID=UPI001CD3ED03|nr:DUF5819 family protein [Streptomyces sp. 8L]MCA1217899.1 DUF5819 family protein [Streptomyces sp. 8L]
MTDTAPAAPGQSDSRMSGITPLVRLLGVLVLAAATVYVAACAVYNMPNSPVKVRIKPAATHVIRPWFEQDWQLFAPTPSTDNAHIYVTARIRKPGGGNATTRPFDIQGPIEDLPKNNRVLPTKQPGITLAFQETFATYRSQLQTIDSAAAASARPQLHAYLNRRFAADFDKLRRLISQQAAARFPGRDIVSVRAEFSQTPITPFSARGSGHFPVKAKNLLDTQWMPYAQGVAQP